MSSDKPIINIITRTSNRPLYFEKCQESIEIQTYPSSNIRKIVTFDEEKDLDEYIQKKYTNLVVLEMEREKRRNQSHFPYHDYLNEVIKYIVENETGWIMVLDDDNTLAKKNSLEILSQYIAEGNNDPNKFYIWKCQKADKVVPSDLSFGKTSKYGDIHISCFVFHASQAGLVFFESKRNAESDIVSALHDKLTCVWINDVLTTAAASGNGLRRDLQIVQDTKKKITLKPSPPIKPEQTKIQITSKKKNDDKGKETVTEEKVICTLNKHKGNEPNDDVDDDDDYDNDDDDDDDDDIEIVEDDTDDEEPVQPTKKCVAPPLKCEKIDSDEEEIIDENESVDSDEEIITSTSGKSLDIDHMIEKEPNKKCDSVTQKESKKPDPVVQKENNTKKPDHVAQKNSNVKNCDPITQKDETSNNCDQSQLFSRFIDLLNKGQKVYILDECNMKQLSKCLYDAFTCIDLEEKLVQVLEGKLIEMKNTEIKSKISKIKSNLPPQLTPNIQQAVPQHVPSQAGQQMSAPIIQTKMASNGFIDKIYIITDDNSQKTVLERNKKIISSCKIEFDIITCKDLALYHYQGQIKDIISNARENNYHRVMILNGNCLLNTKFVGLLERQTPKITDGCYLWFLGNTKETPPKDIVNTKFELEDYLYMYDDIVSAKFTTAEKAKTHWKSYGHREARYGAIDVVNSPPHIGVNYGFVIAEELYDVAIELINKQNQKDCKNFLIDLQKNSVEAKKVWLSRPDLIIPSFANPSANSKNASLALKNGWYYNFYK